MNLFDDIFNKRAKKRAQESFTASLDALGYPYELLETGLNEGEAVEFYRAELKKGEEAGFFPALIVNEPSLFELIAQAKTEGFDIYAAQSAELPEGKRVFEERLANSEILEEEFSQEGFVAQAAADCFTPLDDFSLLFTEFSKSLRMSALIKLPTLKPWEAALYLPFGGCNSCPAPLEMAAMLKAWHEEFGAVPAVFAGDAIEILITLPLDVEKSLKAAKELIAFGAITHPRLDNDPKGLMELAKSLCDKPVWHFWWD